MTTFEHAMLAVNGVLAAGLHRRHGWQLAALAGVAANVPDGDGVAVVCSLATFAAGHRVWGHNLLACLAVGVVLGTLDYRYDLATRGGRWFVKLLRIRWAANPGPPRQLFLMGPWGTWMLVATLAALSHLLADMLVSGTKDLPDWELQPFWPWSRQGWVYPLVPWGDPGMTIVFALGMFALLRWKTRLEAVAGLTLLSLSVYMLMRGWLLC